MKLSGRLAVSFDSVLHLSEVEMRALDALVGYGTDEFIKAFYEKLGQAYMRDHEQGLRSLFEGIRLQVRPELARIDEVRNLLHRERASGGQLSQSCPAPVARLA